ncbi:hypothetical protein ACOME3_003956 [Neoechinorhynchus agilis]
MSSILVIVHIYNYSLRKNIQQSLEQNRHWWMPVETIAQFLSVWVFISFGLILYERYGKNEDVHAVDESRFSQFNRGVALTCLTVFASPLLNTLTNSISTDTIYAMSTLMFALHLIFFDYGFRTSLPQRALSLNTAYFASVCLSSRLNTYLDTFLLISSSVILFLILPPLRNKLNALDSKMFSGTIISLLCFLISVLILSNTKQLLCLYLMFTVFTVFVCPTYLVYLQRFKSVINGPWDEATIPSCK